MIVGLRMAVLHFGAPAPQWIMDAVRPGLSVIPCSDSAWWRRGNKSPDATFQRHDEPLINRAQCLCGMQIRRQLRGRKRNGAERPVEAVLLARLYLAATQECPMYRTMVRHRFRVD